MKIVFGQTERGFEYVDWADIYGNRCELQQSNIALTETPGHGAIWLGCPDHRMHLDREQAQELVKLLNNWLRTGSFAE